MAVEGFDMMSAIYLAAAGQHGAFDYDRVMQTLKGLKWESPRGPVELDPDTRDLTQNVYIRRTERVDGVLQNVELETIANVRGPG
jgi:branched-chain amino acid transport system substrate-binding protein